MRSCMRSSDSSNDILSNNWFEQLPEHVHDFITRLSVQSTSSNLNSVRSGLKALCFKNSHNAADDDEYSESACYFNGATIEENGMHWPSIGVDGSNGIGRVGFEDSSFNSEKISLLSYPSLCFQLSIRLQRIHHFLSFGLYNGNCTNGWLKPRKVIFDECLKIWMSYHQEQYSSSSSAMVNAKHGGKEVKDMLDEYNDDEDNFLNNNNNNNNNEDSPLSQHSSRKRLKLHHGSLGSSYLSEDYCFLIRSKTLQIEIGGKLLKHPLLG
jgi:hypothetical protein